MSIKSKVIEVRSCDFCDATEDDKDTCILVCDNCGKDFCTQCGELFHTEYGDVEIEGYDGELLLCKDCLNKIFNKKKGKIERKEK